MENPTPEQTQMVCSYSDHITLDAHNADVKWRVNSVDGDNRDNTLLAIKRLVRDEILDRETALTVFNTIAHSTGWSEVSTIATTYTVTVTAFGHEVGEFTGVEANDESDAIQTVLQDMIVQDSTLNLELEFNEQYISDSINLDSWSFDLSDYLDAEAVEED